MISFVPGYYGHLGNQMFQYAATRALAARRGVSCAWPSGKIPDLRMVHRIDAAPVTMVGDVWTERQFHFDPEVLDLPDRTILSGYFQSEKYFKDAEGLIRDSFPVFPVERNAVSVHVRRGDYLSFPEHHPPCSVDYYREAMARFPGARFMVFSDDPGWCLLNLKPLGNVEIETGNPAIVDMHMMAQCRVGHIIANSSFSWWGAWLDPNPDKKVVCPSAWFGPAKKDWDTRDLLPESWVRL